MIQSIKGFHQQSYIDTYLTNCLSDENFGLTVIRELNISTCKYIELVPTDGYYIAIPHLKGTDTAQPLVIFTNDWASISYAGKIKYTHYNNIKMVYK